jgi:hypothetical protein
MVAGAMDASGSTPFPVTVAVLVLRDAGVGSAVPRT